MTAISYTFHMNRLASRTITAVATIASAFTINTTGSREKEVQTVNQSEQKFEPTSPDTIQPKKQPESEEEFQLSDKPETDPRVFFQNAVIRCMQGDQPFVDKETGEVIQPCDKTLGFKNKGEIISL